MSGEDWAVLGILLGGYPLLVLLIAITGPHNETEKRELRELRHRRRKSHPASNARQDEGTVV